MSLVAAGAMVGDTREESVFVCRSHPSGFFVVVFLARLGGADGGGGSWCWCRCAAFEEDV